MSNNKLLLKDAHAEPSKIIGIQFGIMSSEEIRRSSVVKVEVRDMYHGNKPVIGSLVDPRMGTQDPKYVCPTDNLDYINTPGYHGHIDMAVPIFYVQYIKDIVKWSNCVCCKCSKLLISKTKYQKMLESLPAKKRWDAVVKACKKVKICGDDTEDGCHAPQPTKIRKDGLATIVAEWTVKDTAGATDKDTKTMSIRWTPEMLYKRFMRISDDDVNFAGFSSVFSRPENMICHTLLVPPPAIRPSVKQESQQRSEDDLTHILMNIIRINNELLQDIQKNAAAKIIEDHTSILQFFVATLVNNSMPGVDALRNRSSRPYKSIISRLGAKGGRMRGNLMAKRVDYSARSVITGEPNLSIEELGIPMPIAMNLTVPVTVTDANMAFLTQLVRNGPDLYPGAKIIKKAGSDYPITLKYMDRESIVLEVGDEVHRHLLNDDMVLFNRQPTLHRMSMQSHKARIMTQGNTFRFNVGVAKPYNADYDGDEMNMHVPQNVMAAVELRLLSAVPYQIISPANHAPIIGPVQDNLLGAYIFTGDNIRFTAQQAMNLMMTCATVNVEKLGDILKSRKYVTSFDILSQITPPISLKYKTKGFNDEKDDAKTSNNILEIRNGEYVRGRMDKSVLSGGSKSLIQRITNDFGNLQSVQYIDNLQNIVTQFMKSHSFSVGISDLISNTKTTQDIARIIDGKRTEVKDIIDQIMMGTFSNNTGRDNNTEFENRVLTILSQASGDAGKIALNSLGASNRFVTMVKAGSKGNENNIAFMTSCLGQQTVEGKRIPDGFQNRTLPHFPQYDEGPMSRGFVTNSYVTGLSPTDLFYHAMAGRVGLIDTAVKTSSTGYIQRRLIKGLEDAMVRYDHTVRSNKGKIIQYSYGDDNIDPLKVETQNIPLVGMSIADIYTYYNFPDMGDKTAAKTVGAIFIKSALAAFKKQVEETAKKCQEYTDRAITTRDDIIKHVFHNRDDNAVNCPVAFAYLISNIQGQSGINQYSLVDITPLEVFAMIEAAMADLDKIHTAPPTALFKALYYYYLAPKELLLIKRFNRAAIVRLLDTIKLTYKQAIVAPGEMVGPVAAQSIGEISTQMTLNSFVYETPILVRNRAGVIREVELGKFATEFIDKATRKEYYADKDTTYAELDDFYEVPSCDEEGHLTWERIEAVTRHPVINEDGSNTMLKVTTDEEREVIATKAKSFLKLVDGRVIGVNGDSLKVGDYLPVSNMPLECVPQRTLNLREFLPATEYLYSNELHMAYQCCAQKGKGNGAWWQKGNGKLFTLPYSGSDTVTSQLLKLERGTAKPIPMGCIYMPKLRLTNGSTEPSAIPEQIPLDYQFGYLLGAYAAEGCITKHQVSISNNIAEFYAPIIELCERWKLTTKQYVHKNKIQEGWTSSDIRIYNTLLCHILNKFIGKLSHNKFISDHIIYSNRECVLGFLDAYISGDGGIGKSGIISMGSVSKQLLEGVQKMLNTIGVYSHIRKNIKRTSNNRGTKPENFQQPYTLTVSGKQNLILARQLKPTIDYKRDALKNILNHAYQNLYTKTQEVVPNEINGELVFEPRHEINHKDLLFNKIVSIEEVPNTTPYAYDLTVERTRNFVIANSLACQDTFHNVGILSKTNATRGVPRIDEILSLSKEIKSPSLTVFLKQEDRTHKDRAQELMYKMEHTTLGELVNTTAIYFDPDDLNTLIDEDTALLAQYKEFETMVGECANVNLSNTNVSKSKWLLRMEMDPETMLEKNITMDDIHFTLNNIYKDQISCVFSDYNADKLVFRVRMTEVIKQNASKTAVNKKPLNQSDQIYILKNFQDNLLKNVVIRGVKGIKKVSMRKVKNNMVEHNGTYVTEDQWVLDTAGSNLLDVLALDYIDYTKTYSNDIIETFEVLGIEAARQAIFNEFVDVIKFDGTYIDYHHFALLCDRMCYSESPISIYRHGIKNDNIGVLAKASFEETADMLMNAAKHGELDVMTGVSANVMCGQEGLYGTNAFKVLLDMSEIGKMKPSAEYKYLNREKELADMLKEGAIAADADECGVKNLSVQNGVVNIAGADMGEQNDDYTPF